MHNFHAIVTFSGPNICYRDVERDREVGIDVSARWGEGKEREGMGKRGAQEGRGRRAKNLYKI